MSVMQSETQTPDAGIKDGRKPRNMGHLQKLESKEVGSPPEHPERNSPDTLILAEG